MYLKTAVEGDLDAAVAHRLVQDAGASVAVVHGRSGKNRLLQQLAGFNAAAAHNPWLVLIDLNSDHECAPPAIARWLPEPADLMCFRAAVREAEAWLLADRSAFARFLGVSAALLPHHPEAEPDPKGLVVQVARRSRSRIIREALVPSPGSRRAIGPGYTGRLIEFVQTPWLPTRAAERSDSLARCLSRVKALVAEAA